jgi:hypothetical protein
MARAQVVDARSLVDRRAVGTPFAVHQSMNSLRRSVAAALLVLLGLAQAQAFAAEPRGTDDKEGALPAPQPTRGPVLPVLYVSLAALNTYDALSTLQGVQNGARETNGLLAPVAGSAPAMWVVKGTATAASILAAERLWKSNRRAQAIAVLAVTNGMMAVVAARNASVLRQQR